MLEFRYLPAFFAVAESHSFTKAGQKLHIATSAVSRQIQLLEEACNAQLFFRSSREAKLTDIGERLFDELQHFIKSAEMAISAKSITTLRLGSLQGVLQHWLVQLIGTQSFFKDLNLDIHVSNPEELLQSVASGKLDAAFLSLLTVTHIPASLRVIRLFCEEIVLISREKITIDQLDEFPWIVFSASTWIHQYRKRSPERYIIVNDMSSIFELTRKGMGIAMVPSHLIADRSGLHILPIKKFSKEYIYVVVRRYKQEPLVITQFLKLMRSLPKSC